VISQSFPATSIHSVLLQQVARITENVWGEERGQLIWKAMLIRRVVGSLNDVFQQLVQLGTISPCDCMTGVRLSSLAVETWVVQRWDMRP